MSTETTIQQFMPDVRIARRKGTKVRLQNIRTAKMGPWVPAPMRRTVRVSLGRRAGKTAAMQAEARAYWQSHRIGDVSRDVVANRMTVPELRNQLDACGISYTSRMRKAQLVAALLGTELA